MTDKMASDPAVTLDHTVVYAQYGQTMLAVQLFEVQLANIAMLAEAKRRMERGGRVPLRDEVNRMLDQAFHWMWRASASEARNRAEELLPDELAGDIEQAIKWRNRLAHRYLREQLSFTEDDRFARGTLKELEELKRDLEKLGRRLLAEFMRMRDEMTHDEDPPDGVSEALHEAMRSVATGGRANPSRDRGVS